MVIVTGSSIKELRKKSGITQKKLSDLVGVTQAHIAKIENEKVNPRLSTVNKIMSVLNGTEVVACEKVMSTKIISLKPTDKATDAIKLMKSADISQIPIIDKSMCVGSITDKGLMQQMDINLKKRTVRDIMEKPFPIIAVEDSINIAKNLLEHHHAVLISMKGKIVGIITKSDLLSLMK